MKSAHMKKYISGFGTVALALLMGGLPAAAFAETNGEDGLGVQVQAQAVGIEASTSVTEHASGENEAAREQQKQQQEVSREQQKNQLEASSTDEQHQQASSTRPSIKGGEDGELGLELEDGGIPAHSFGDLKQNIELRKQQLEQEAASTSPDFQTIVTNANPVRLAVHSFLASKDLLGGIGQQVSEIAKNMNDSVATTTNAEVQIQSRGFLTRLLFGGDTAAADVIKNEVAQNQQHIDELTKLLGGTNVSADIKATLTAQITALQGAQTRLQDLAQKEQSTWGLFSWRF
ncbi:MAG: hypothetical protein ACHQU0_01180 [Candidatus Paceibacteria bacterium]